MSVGVQQAFKEFDLQDQNDASKFLDHTLFGQPKKKRVAASKAKSPQQNVLNPAAGELAKKIILLSDIDKYVFNNKKRVENDYLLLKASIEKKVYFLRAGLISTMTKSEQQSLREQLLVAWYYAYLLSRYYSTQKDNPVKAYLNQAEAYRDDLKVIHASQAPKPQESDVQPNSVPYEVKSLPNGSGKTLADIWAGVDNSIYKEKQFWPRAAIWAGEIKERLAETFDSLFIKREIDLGYESSAMIKRLLQFIGSEVNTKRLTWVWTQGMLSSVFTILNNQGVLNQAAITRLNLPNTVMGAFAFSLYFFRLGVNISAAVKHASHAAKAYRSEEDKLNAKNAPVVSAANTKLTDLKSRFENFQRASKRSSMSPHADLAFHYHEDEMLLDAHSAAFDWRNYEQELNTIAEGLNAAKVPTAKRLKKLKQEIEELRILLQRDKEQCDLAEVHKKLNKVLSASEDPSFFSKRVEEIPVFAKHLWRQICDRKYALLNDIAWGIVNLITMYWVLGTPGNLVTIALLCFDAGLGVAEYIEEGRKYDKRLAVKTTELKALSKDFDEALAQGKEEDARALMTKKKALQRQIDVLEDGWVDTKNRVLVQIATGMMYIGAFTLMCAGMGTLIPTMALPAVILIGSAAAFALDVTSKLISKGREIDKLSRDIAKKRGELAALEHRKGALDGKNLTRGGDPYQSIASLEAELATVEQEIGHHYQHGWLTKEVPGMVSLSRTFSEEPKSATFERLKKRRDSLKLKIKQTQRLESLQAKSVLSEKKQKELEDLAKKLSIFQRLECLAGTFAEASKKVEHVEKFIERDEQPNKDLNAGHGRAMAEKLALKFEIEGLEAKLSLPKQIAWVDKQIEALEKNENTPLSLGMSKKALADKKQRLQGECKAAERGLSDAKKAINSEIAVLEQKRNFARVDFVFAAACALTIPAAIGLACAFPLAGGIALGAVVTLCATFRLGFWAYKKLAAKQAEEHSTPRDKSLSDAFIQSAASNDTDDKKEVNGPNNVDQKGLDGSKEGDVHGSQPKIVAEGGRLGSYVPNNTQSYSSVFFEPVNKASPHDTSSRNQGRKKCFLL